MDMGPQLAVQEVQLKIKKKAPQAVSPKLVCQVEWKLNKNKNGKRPQYTTHVSQSSHQELCDGRELKLSH